MKKRLFSLLIVLVLCVLTLLPALAFTQAAELTGNAENDSLHSDRLIDGGDLLTAAQETAIAERLDEVSERHDLDCVIVTVNTLGGKEDMEFADDYYDYHGYRADGILLLYCPNEGARYISTTGDAQYIFVDDRFYELTDQIVPYFDRGDFNGACLTFADACDEIITAVREEYADSSDSYYGYYAENFNSERRSVFSWWIVAFGLLIGAVLSFLIPMNVMKGKLRSVRAQSAASDYVRPGSMNLTQNRDVFLFANITKTPIPKDTSSRSGGGGGGGFHVGSSGTSHGGGRF